MILYSRDRYSVHGGYLLVAQALLQGLCYFLLPSRKISQCRRWHRFRSLTQHQDRNPDLGRNPKINKIGPELSRAGKLRQREQRRSGRIVNLRQSPAKRAHKIIWSRHGLGFCKC